MEFVPINQLRYRTVSSHTLPSMGDRMNPQKKIDVTVPPEARKPYLTQPPTRVGDVMTTAVVTLSPHHTFPDAIALMANRPFRHFLVVEENLQLVGVVSDRDLLRALARIRNWQSTTVSDIMTKDTVTVQPDTPLSVAVETMLERRINCLPVVADKGTVCGVLTSTDLLAAYQRLQTSLERITKNES